jgi:hypothetical protein
MTTLLSIPDHFNTCNHPCQARTTRGRLRPARTARSPRKATDFDMEVLQHIQKKKN